MNVSSAELNLLCTQRHSWEQGVAVQAFLEADRPEIAFALCKAAVCRKLVDGRIAIMDDVNAVTDPCSMGEALHRSATQTGDAELLCALDELRAWALSGAPRSADGIVYHVMDAPQFWVDSMYMLPPFLAAIGEKDEAMKQLNGYEAALLDPATGLMAHRWDDEAKRLVRAAHWGVGNGWTLMAYARLIGLLPERARELTERAKRLIDALLPYMRDDGLFYDVVDDPRSFVETNLSQMLCYTLCRGMREGWLSGDYARAAQRLHEAALGKTDECGIVRGVCGAPDFDKSGTAPEAQAFQVMVQTQWTKWKEND